MKEPLMLCAKRQVPFWFVVWLSSRQSVEPLRHGHIVPWPEKRDAKRQDRIGGPV